MRLKIKQNCPRFPHSVGFAALRERYDRQSPTDSRISRMNKPPFPLPQLRAAAPMRAGGTISRLPIALAPVLLLLATALAGCGQKGPLFIPDTPAAAQRATLPQTIFGGGKASDAEAQQQRPEDGQPAAPDIDLDSEP